VHAWAWEALAPLASSMGNAAAWGGRDGMGLKQAYT